MLSSFIQTQKHSVAERLKRKFEAKYITSVTDHNQLLHFLLRKMFKAQLDLEMLNEREDAEDLPEVKVETEKFQQEAAQSDLRNSTEYFDSVLFQSMFEFGDAAGKSIVRKAIAA